jgi:hypothetical protein
MQIPRRLPALADAAVTGGNRDNATGFWVLGAMLDTNHFQGLVYCRKAAGKTCGDLQTTKDPSESGRWNARWKSTRLTFTRCSHSEPENAAHI